MNVKSLRSILRDLDDDVEVRIAAQPNWPFEYSCEAVATDPTEGLSLYFESDAENHPEGWWVVNDNEDPGDDEYWVAGPYQDRGSAQEKLDEAGRNKTVVLYIAEDEQLGYLPGDAREALSW